MRKHRVLLMEDVSWEVRANLLYINEKCNAFSLVEYVFSINA
jgi:hypothetical protein